MPWLAGGFIGVDVFFVLSGYLITGLLIREFESTGRIDFARFYARRVQRLFPAVLLAVAATSLAAMVLLAPFEQSAQAESAAAAITWTSNFLFALQQLDYFGSAADGNLFLHTWSLGVEEQFYLLWPAWMLFLLGAWSWQGSNRNRKHLLSGLVGTGVASLALAIFLTFHQPQLGFYMMFSRGWQFVLGALAFLLPDGRPPMRGERIAGWLSLLAIVATALVVRTNTPYPGYWAIAPSLATALFLTCGRSGGCSGSANRLISIRPMQWIGGISYTWYLWHWPVLLLGAAVVPLPKAGHVAIFALASLGLAMASHRLVEAPLRLSQWLRAKPWFVLGGSAVISAAIVIASTTWTKRADKWSQSRDQVRYAIIRGDQPEFYAKQCDDWYHSARVRPCVFGDPDATHTAVLMGDSVAAQWFPAMEHHFVRQDWRLVVLTKSACPMVDQPVFYAPIGRRYTECEAWRNYSLSAIADLHPDIVLLGSSLDYDFTARQWSDGTARILSRIAATSPRIAVMAPTPILPFDGPACLARRDWRREWMPAPDTCVADYMNGRLRGVEESLRDAVAGQPQARLVDLNTAVCPGGLCRAEREGLVVYRDRRHLAAGFAATLEDDLVERLDGGWGGTKSDVGRH